MPFDVCTILRRIFFIQDHIAQQSRAGITAFQQVMTKDAVIGKYLAHRLLENIDIIDPLSDE